MAAKRKKDEVEYDPANYLDKRITASTKEGVSMEWRLVARNDNRVLKEAQWKPFTTDIDGKVLTHPKWMPLPGSQQRFLTCPVFEALFTGGRGPGKTATLLMDFAKDVGKGHGKAWRGILFRRTYGDLDDVVKKLEEVFPQIFGDKFRFLKSKSEYRAEWDTGEALLLRSLEREEDYDEYHGHEYPWIGFEELTQWENDKVYRLMFSCSRSSKPGVPCRIRSTTNPSGKGHNWVKKRFELPHNMGKVIRIPGEMPRVAIHGELKENFLLLHQQPFYATIIANAATNPAQQKAWMFGSWDVTSGGMFDDIWDAAYHVLPNIPVDKIPRGWSFTRAYDHGQSHPFAVGWFLESNGEPIELEDGRRIGNVRGDLILWEEWYGTSGADNEGVRMSTRNIAVGIKDRENDLGAQGLFHPGPADTEIWTKDSRGTGRGPIDDMEDVGVYWERADKSPGSRTRGWEMIRTFLGDAKPGPDGTRERPGFFVCSRCKYWLELMPVMPRGTDNPDDCPKKYEDHLGDMTRYRVNWVRPFMFRKGNAF